MSERGRRHYRRQVAEGNCVRCGRASVKERVLCAACNRKRAVAAAALTEVCRDCRKPLLSGTGRCDACKLKLREEYARHVRAGVCVKCRKPAVAGAFCLDHWLLNLGRPHGLTRKGGGLQLLKELWEGQNGRCAVTGEVLVPGVNASLDHIVPRSRGGSSDRSNLQWVTSQVNHMKWDLTHEEFVAMCAKVASRHALVASLTTDGPQRSAESRSN